MSTDCRLRQWLTRASLLVLLVTLTACASPKVQRPPTPTLTATSVPFPALTGALGPLPTSCPAGPQLATFSIDATFGGGFVAGDVFTGRSPVWNLGLTTGQRWQLESSQGTVTPSPHPGIKIMWIVGPNYHQPVTLSGHELATGGPVWFDLGGVAESPGDPMAAAVLDPTAPNRGSTTNATGSWNIWGIVLYFFAAGCYQIDADWAGGSWQLVLAVGR